VTSIDRRKLDPALRDELRLRAILTEALAPMPAATGAALVERIRRRFEPLGGVELELPPREPGREPPRFG
jgi:hypothetical protein